ncbi:MAG: HAMP domain-containing sensor histidine kinase, partial [Solirubrobacteraceae bacterium]|nr:HAMP domain-containing sensor histidine kinase [Solirubrobacteraceae bacterium]
RRSGLPIRWRLALLIASVTSIVLIAFALVISTTTTSRLRDDFRQSVQRSTDDLATRLEPTIDQSAEGDQRYNRGEFALTTFARGGNAYVRVVTRQGVLAVSQKNVDLGLRAPGDRVVGNPTLGDLYVVTRPLTDRNAQLSGEPILVQYARRTQDVERTIGRINLLLIAGTLLGSLVALAGASWIGGRALRPVSELTAEANAIAQTGDGSRRLPVPDRKDELGELALTLDAMLDSLAAAQSTTEKTLQGQREFLADASHELRTPLTSVITNLEMLADTDDPDHAESAESALRSARRMRGLVADLLALARADEASEITKTPLDLSSVVTDAVAEVEDLLVDHVLEVETEPVPIAGRRDDLQRVIRNLLENAARHTPPGTTVRVIVGRRGGHASLAVEDDGPGLSPSVRGRAFERFVKSGSRSGPSSGLGLSIVRASAQAHGGWVELRSPARAGRGTRVEVRLPLDE